MRKIHIFLHRPQFSRLKKLVPPDMYRTLNRNVFDCIANACPYLEELDVSGLNSKRHFAVVPDSE